MSSDTYFHKKIYINQLIETSMPADIDYFTQYKMNDKSYANFCLQLPGYLKQYFEKALSVGREWVLQGYRGPYKFLEKDASGDSEFQPSSSGIQEIKFRYGVPKILSFTIFIPLAPLDIYYRNRWGSLFFDQKTGQILSNDRQQARQKLKQKLRLIQQKNQEQRKRRQQQLIILEWKERKEKQFKERIREQRHKQQLLRQAVQREARETERIQKDKKRQEKQFEEQRIKEQKRNKFYLKQEAQRKAREIEREQQKKKIEEKERKEKQQKEEKQLKEEICKKQKRQQKSLMRGVQIEIGDPSRLSRLIGKVELYQQQNQNLSPELRKILDRLYDKIIQRDIKDLNIQKAKINCNLMQERRNKIDQEKQAKINQLEYTIRTVRQKITSHNKEDLVTFHQLLTNTLQDERYKGGVGLLALQRLVELRIDRKSIESLIQANKQKSDINTKRQLIKKMQANLVREEAFSSQFGFLFSQQGKIEIRSQISKFKALIVKLEKIQQHKDQQVFTEMSIELRQLQKKEQISVDNYVVEKMMKEQVEALEK